jgi:hypothetical protein
MNPFKEYHLTGFTVSFMHVSYQIRLLLSQPTAVFKKIEPIEKWIKLLF